MSNAGLFISLVILCMRSNLIKALFIYMHAYIIEVIRSLIIVIVTYASCHHFPQHSRLRQCQLAPSVNTLSTVEVPLIFNG